MRGVQPQFNIESQAQIEINDYRRNLIGSDNDDFMLNIRVDGSADPGINVFFEEDQRNNGIFTTNAPITFTAGIAKLFSFA